MPAVNHDYPVANAMKVVAPNGEPIENAEVRIYSLVNFQAGSLSSWVGSTITDINGEWVDPIVLPIGNTWVVHVQKLTMYGPNHIEITT